MDVRGNNILAKNNDTKDPENYRPITCLLTLVLTDRTYSHLEQNNFFPLEQKGCRRGSHGCKDQLMVNKMTTEKRK